ncbi:SGNH/GDSL hydrolase family protein [Pseudaestuariivita sp.]|uniref:SGNH/GDSL hydrolase family protein n=1 Tax=Pseudaestuariivita sp. TaxID=2211669 RepID=UPI004059D9C4
MARATPLIDWPLRAALAPLLIAQGLHVRRTARTLQEPPGPRAGTQPEAAHHLLIVGDSSAAGVGCEHQSEALSGQLTSALAPHMPLSWELRARCGDRTKDALAKLDAPFERTPTIAVTALGVNDVTKGTSVSQWTARQTLLLNRLTALGAQHIYACALPPLGHFPLLPNPLRWLLGRQAEAFDARLQTLCRAHPNARHVPFDFPMDIEHMAPDGYHPGPAIYATWANHLATLILKDLG